MINQLRILVKQITRHFNLVAEFRDLHVTKVKKKKKEREEKKKKKKAKRVRSGRDSFDKNNFLIIIGFQIIKLRGLKMKKEEP